jgi:hypothetical protein
MLINNVYKQPSFGMARFVTNQLSNQQIGENADLIHALSETAEAIEPTDNLLITFKPRAYDTETKSLGSLFVELTNKRRQETEGFHAPQLDSQTNIDTIQTLFEARLKEFLGLHGNRPTET